MTPFHLIFDTVVSGPWLETHMIELTSVWTVFLFKGAGGFRLLDKVTSFDISIMISAQRWKIY